MQRTAPIRNLAVMLAAVLMLSPALVRASIPCQAATLTGVTPHDTVAGPQTAGKHRHERGEHNRVTAGHHQVAGETGHALGDIAQTQTAAGPEVCCAAKDITSLSIAVPPASKEGHSLHAAHPAGSITPDTAHLIHACQVRHLHHSASGSPPTKHKPFGSLLI